MNIENEMKNVFFTLDDGRKNFLVVYTWEPGRIEVAHDAKTDDELADAVTDFFDYNAISALEVGQSCKLSDGWRIVLRVS